MNVKIKLIHIFVNTNRDVFFLILYFFFLINILTLYLKIS